MNIVILECLPCLKSKEIICHSFPSLYNNIIPYFMKKISLYIQSIFYLSSGINHFRNPDFYLALIPPYFKWHEAINFTAGLAEIVLALLLIITKSRKIAAYGILAILLIFIPAHIYFIQMGSCLPNGLSVPPWLGWVRLLVMQPLLIAWAAWYRK